MSVAAPSLGTALGGFHLLEALRLDNRPVIDQFLAAVPQTERVPQIESPLHLAVLCAEPKTIDYIIRRPGVSVNMQDQKGNTPLHLALDSGRTDATALLLSRPELDDTIVNDDGQAPVECVSNIAIAQLLQNARVELRSRILELLVDYEKDQSKGDALLAIVQLPRVNAIDLLVTNPETGNDVLEAAVRHGNRDLMAAAIKRGADPYSKDATGKSADDVAPDASTRALLRQLSNAGSAEQTTHSPTFRGFLEKWTNMVGGFKLRWFVLSNGVLSYYQSPEDEGRHTRGSTYMRYATIRTEKDPTRFEIISRVGNGSNKMYLRANDAADSHRWVQILEASKRFHQSAPKTTTAAAAAAPQTLAPTDGQPQLAPAVGAIPARTVSPAPEKSTAMLQVPGGAPSPSARTSATFAATDTERGPDLFDDNASEVDASSVEDSALDPSDGLPHTREISIIANLLNTYFDLSLNALSALESQNGAAPTVAPGVPPIPVPQATGQLAAPIGQLTTQPSQGSSDALRELRKALDERYSLWQRYAKLIEEREDVLKRRLDHEIMARRLWEENITSLAHQQNELEQSLNSARTIISGQRQEISKAKGSSDMPPRSESVDDEFFECNNEDGADTSASGGAAAKGGILGAATGAAGAAAGMAGLSLGDKKEAPKDAAQLQQQQGQQPQQQQQDQQPQQQDQQPQQPQQQDQPQQQQPSGEPGKDSPGFPTDAPGFEPYAHLRDRMPIRNDERPHISLWSILKNNIGKDLSKISFPVSFNEPTSMLQRMAEDMEFSECLDAAARQKDPLRRIMYVAAFGMSNYSSTIGRIAKPFNPLLGETFEYARPDRRYRYISEQVSHHPPISACFSESPTWEYMGCVDAKSKFLGRTFEIRPTGIAHANIKVPKEWTGRTTETAVNDRELVKEHFSWNKVITSVSGFIVGQPTIDHYGQMNVVNHATGDKCILEFVPPSWRSSSNREVRGKVISAAGKEEWEIAGRWGTQLVGRRVGTGNGPLTPEAETGYTDVLAGCDAQDLLLLWRNSEKPKTPFSLTPFAITLNSYPEGLRPWLPPTDCRQRPDLRAFETGHFDDADRLKVELEEFQRSKRRRREAGELPPHKPHWFSQTVDEDSRATFWKPHMAEDNVGAPRMSYWIVRDQVGQKRVHGDEQADWPGVDHIFGDIGRDRQ